ncbi:unnamed protein product, partial [Amoebophrya sp. A120]
VPLVEIETRAASGTRGTASTGGQEFPPHIKGGATEGPASAAGARGGCARALGSNTFAPGNVSGTARTSESHGTRFHRGRIRQRSLCGEPRENGRPGVPRVSRGRRLGRVCFLLFSARCACALCFEPPGVPPFVRYPRPARPACLRRSAALPRIKCAAAKCMPRPRRGLRASLLVAPPACDRGKSPWRCR